MKTLAVRVINADKTSGPNNDFLNSTEVGSVITAPDWSPKQVCGYGIHGWLWGMGREGKEHAGNKIWQVVEVPDDGVDLGGKWKWRQVTVVYSGTQAEAMRLTMEGRQKYIQERNSASTSGWGSSASTSGDGSSASMSGDGSSASTSGWGSSASTSGDVSSASTSGWRSSASTSGDRSSASTSGDGSSASTSGRESSASTSGRESSASTSGLGSSASTSGDVSSASASGWGSSASTSGISSPAVCAGVNCEAKAGLYGYIVLGYMVGDHIEYKGSPVGPNGLKPDTWYKLEDGEFVEC